MTNGMHGRYMTSEREPRHERETVREARARRERDRLARSTASAYNGAVCARCGHVRANVVHATNPAEEPEGAAYYEDVTFCEFEGLPVKVSGGKAR